MPSRKQRAITGVPDEAWTRLGRALQAWREDVLGYKTRTGFARERLPLTEDGNPNVKLAQDLENSYRPGTYTKWSLEDAEKAYGITHESVLAFLHGEADTLLRDIRAAEPPDYTPPMDDADRVASDRRWFDEIQGRLDLLRARGIRDPSGRQLFPDAPEDAKAWDGIGARLDIGARAWFIADLRRRADGRAGNSGTGTDGA